MKLTVYNGYYCFEAITERDLDSVICGVCGVIGEVYLGDGNEKNCCSNGNVSFLKLYNTIQYCMFLSW